MKIKSDILEQNDLNTTKIKYNKTMFIGRKIYIFGNMGSSTFSNIKPNF